MMMMSDDVILYSSAKHSSASIVLGTCFVFIQVNNQGRLSQLVEKDMDLLQQMVETDMDLLQWPLALGHFRRQPEREHLICLVGVVDFFVVYM